MAKTERWNDQTDWIRLQIVFGYRVQVRNERTRITSSSMGTRTFSFIHLRNGNRTTNQSPSTAATN